MGSVKKRGRPLGSKNKPKTVRITKVEAELAKKIGVPVTKYAQEKLKLNRKPRAKKFDWERLAKQLQSALKDEFVENENLVKKVGDLEFEVANLKHQAIGYRAVVSYLENKIEHDTVRGN